MELLELYIGDKHLSSWSMRPWLLMKYFEIPFKERLIKLDQIDSKERLAKISPSSLVPMLIDKDLKIWDSLAICEYLVEKFPKLNLWPESQKLRAVARSICSEMHSGFRGLRKECSMKLLEVVKDRKALSDDTEKEVARIDEIWNQCRELSKSHGEFLFGDFSIADAFFMPVISRVRSYSLPIKGHNSQVYYNHMIASPLFKLWLDEAKAGL